MNIRTLTLFFALLSATAPAFAELDADILSVQHQWAEAKYNTAEADQKQAMDQVVIAGRALVDAYPDRAEPKIWLAIALSTDAGINGGLGALGEVKEARKLLESAEKIDPTALDGSIYTSLGSLYYQVPGWPIGFGNDKKAAAYLQKALAINPEGIDPNFFYGDFLLDQEDYEQAVVYLVKAGEAPDRPERPLADAGRRAEIDVKLAQARGQLQARR
jgi:tetratricopeptide (TPR) repeat protein